MVWRKLWQSLTSGTSRGIEGQDSLDGNIHGRNIEGFKHDLSHLLSVGLWVERGFSQQGGMLLWSHTELIVESVMPDLETFKSVMD